VSNTWEPVSDRIVRLVLGDLLERHGFDRWWETVPPATQHEVREALAVLIAEEVWRYANTQSGWLYTR
jgi:hypothetical protein